MVINQALSDSVEKRLTTANAIAANAIAERVLVSLLINCLSCRKVFRMVMKTMNGRSYESIAEAR